MSVCSTESRVPRTRLHSSHVGDQPDAKKVLVVDDDPVILKVISAKLESKGSKVVTASDASRALGLAREECPDLVLLDVNFPPDIGGVDWDGFRIIQWLRMNEDVRDVPIIVMSGNYRPEYQQRSAEMGAAGFLPKSIHSEGLLDCVEMAIHQVNTAKPSPTTSTKRGKSPEPAFRPPPSAPKSADTSAPLELGTI
jgi:CheY-like chemotaxis protein